MKRCSTSLIIREIQIKTTIRYYLIHWNDYYKKPPRKIENNKYWQGCREIGTLAHYW